MLLYTAYSYLWPFKTNHAAFSKLNASKQLTLAP
jgi:hypothetical protein